MLLSLVASALSWSAYAEVPTKLLPGTLTDAFSVAGTGGWHCGADPGIALFQRAAPTAQIPLPPVTFAFPAIGYGQTYAGYSFQGTALLSFTTVTAGTVAFDYEAPATAQTKIRLPSGVSFPFKAYQATWNSAARTLLVTFTIAFPTCTLPITAFFRS